MINILSFLSKLTKFKSGLLVLGLGLLIGVLAVSYSSDTQAHTGSHEGGEFRIWQSGDYLYGQWTAPNSHRFYQATGAKWWLDIWTMFYVDDPAAECEDLYTSGTDTRDSDFTNAYDAKANNDKRQAIIELLDSTGRQTTNAAKSNSIVADLSVSENKYVSPTQPGLHGKYICASIIIGDGDSPTETTYEYWASDTAIDLAPPEINANGVAITTEKDYTSADIGLEIEITVIFNENIVIKTSSGSNPTGTTTWPRIRTDIPNWGGHNNRGDSYLELTGDKTTITAVSGTNQLSFKHVVGYDTRAWATDPNNPDTFDDRDGQFDFSQANLSHIEFGDYVLEDAAGNAITLTTIGGVANSLDLTDAHKTSFSINIDTKVILEIIKPADSSTISASIDNADYFRNSISFATVDARLEGSGYAWYKSPDTTQPTSCKDMVGDPTQSNNQGLASTIIEEATNWDSGNELFSLPNYDDHYYCAVVVEANAYKSAPPDDPGDRNVDALRVSYSEPYHHVDPNPPVVDPIPPVIDPVPPVTDPIPPVIDPVPPVVNPNPPANNNPPPSDDPPQDQPANLPRDQTPPKVGFGSLQGDIYSLEVTDTGSGLRSLAWGLITDSAPNNQCNSDSSFNNIVMGSTITIDITDQPDFSICIRASDQVGNIALVRRDISRDQLNPPSEEPVEQEIETDPNNDQAPATAPDDQDSLDNNPTTSQANTETPQTPSTKPQPQTSPSNNNNEAINQDDIPETETTPEMETIEEREEDQDQTADTATVSSSNGEQQASDNNPSTNTDSSSSNSNDETPANDEDEDKQSDDDGSAGALIVGSLIAVIVVVALIAVMRKK